jgi:hypothetical protein
VLQESLRSVSPRLVEAIPAGLRAPIVALDPRDAELEGARVLNDLAGWWWGLLIAALLAAAACAGLAGGVRDALVRLGIAVAGAGLIVAAAEAGLGAFVVSHAAHAADLSEDNERGALDALWSALFSDLRSAGLVAALGGVVVATLAHGGLSTRRLVAGAGRLRRLASSPSPAARRAWALGLIALGAALLLEPALVLRAVVTGAGAVLVLVGAAALTGRVEGARSNRTRPAATPLLLGGAVAAVVAATAAAIALVLPAPGTAPANDVQPTSACNGSRALCERRLNEVVFPATHNSYAAADQPGWFFANQRFGIERQLRDGIRAFLIDVHYGARDPGSGRIRTDLAGEGSSRNKVAQQLSPRALRTADRLVGRVGINQPTGPRRAYLCHTLCELGAEPLDEELEVIRRFLSDNPGEVILLFIEPYVPVEEVERALEETDLLSSAAGLRRDQALPTLGELVEAETRLVVLTEQGGGARPWYLDGFSFAQDTPLGATNASELSCGRFRGNPDSPIFLINHWIDTFPPSPSRNERIGGGTLEGRLQQCERQRRLLPNLVAVDFYERTEVMRIADRLNARRPQ